MSNYKRYYQKGSYYFFTLVTYQRCRIFTNENCIKEFKLSLHKIKNKYPFTIIAYVILPDHLHFIWKLPNDEDYSLRWRLIKRDFSMKLNSKKNARNEKFIWQRRFWEHAIRSENELQKYMNYIHYNPVKHGLCDLPSMWAHSSFEYWVNKNLYAKDWSADSIVKLSDFE